MKTRAELEDRELEGDLLRRLKQRARWQVPAFRAAVVRRRLGGNDGDDVLEPGAPPWRVPCTGFLIGTRRVPSSAHTIGCSDDGTGWLLFVRDLWPRALCVVISLPHWRATRHARPAGGAPASGRFGGLLSPSLNWLRPLRADSRPSLTTLVGPESAQSGRHVTGDRVSTPKTVQSRHFASRRRGACRPDPAAR